MLPSPAFSFPLIRQVFSECSSMQPSRPPPRTVVLAEETQGEKTVVGQCDRDIRAQGPGSDGEQGSPEAELGRLLSLVTSGQGLRGRKPARRAASREWRERCAPKPLGAARMPVTWSTCVGSL